MSHDRWNGHERIDLGSQLLDRQIIGPNGEAVGKVDDLELHRRADGSLEVTALLVGVSVLRERTPRGADWLLRMGQRLTGGPDEPRRVGLEQVTDVRSEVRVTAAGAEAAANPAERRTRKFVARIPGAGHESE
jgi:sporulation protein YlmC with PRC-barrel domain